MVYRILDSNGKAIGSYVNASELHSKATLKFIEARFKENQTKRLPFKSRIQNSIDKCLLGKSIPLVTLMKDLEKLGIHMEVNRNDAGILRSVIYVDHQTKSIFNGDDLGKPYKAEGIQERCRAEQNIDHDLHYAEKKISLQVVAEESSHSEYTFNLTRSERRLDPTLVNERAAKTDPDESEKYRKRKKRKQLGGPS